MLIHVDSVILCFINEHFGIGRTWHPTRFCIYGGKKGHILVMDSPEYTNLYIQLHAGNTQNSSSEKCIECVQYTLWRPKLQ